MKILGVWVEFHPIVNYYHRVRYGLGCCDKANFSSYVAHFVAPRLRMFRKEVGSHPSEFSHEEWLAMLAKMQFAFDQVASGAIDEMQFRGDSEKCGVNFEQYWDEVTEGFELFGKYYMHLWR